MVKQLAALLSICILSGALCLRTQAAVTTIDIVSDAAVLMDADTGQVLFEKNARDLMYPASTTKIMTALLTVEAVAPYERLTVSQSAIAIEEPDSANIDLQAGEILSVEDALYALMLPSANDAANALAEFVAGSQQDFVRLMNQKASEIGAVDTNFQNPHGLDEDDHLTTAYDMALITRYAARNENFMQYFGASEYEMQATNLTPARSFTNYQRMLVPDTIYYSPDILGGKVGLTDDAGHTMSTIATKNGRTLVCVVFRSPNLSDKFDDTRLLLDYGYDEFSEYTVTADRFEQFQLPTMQEGVQVGTATFHYNNSHTMLLHNDINPEGIGVRYARQDNLELTDIQDCFIQLVYDGYLPDGIPAVLSSIPMDYGVEIDVFPVMSTVAEESAGSFSLLGLNPLLLLLIPAIPLLLLIIAVLVRNHKLEKKRKARQRQRALNSMTPAPPRRRSAIPPQTRYHPSKRIR